MPAKWASSQRQQQHQHQQHQQQQHSKRNSHVEFEDQPSSNTLSCRNSLLGQVQTVWPPTGELDASADIKPEPSKQTSSSRKRIAGYLVTKLSNLTSLAASSSASQAAWCGQLNTSSSMSAPASPLNKTRQPSPRANLSSVLDSNQLANCGRDYSGCDFLLLIDVSAKTITGAGQSTGSGNNQASSSSCPSLSNSNLTGQSGNNSSLLVIHLVAPNLQEKAAWMSDISQVSFELHFVLCLFVCALCNSVPCACGGFAQLDVSPLRLGKRSQEVLALPAILGSSLWTLWLD